jgi:inosine-uridine nucleoside N-ribohydrolase
MIGKSKGEKTIMMFHFANIPASTRIERLRPPTGKVRMVLDTDTYNEIDDQFAVVYGLLSPEKLDIKAIYAAPFSNQRAASPAEGMQKSYEEILRLFERLAISPEKRVFQGSPGYLKDETQPYRSDAALDLIQRASQPRDAPLYVVAIGAITNVASAMLLEPQIIERIVVVWLCGHALHWPHVNEFNLRQDLLASRLLFDCGVPLVHLPCLGVVSHLATTVPEIERYVRGRGAIGDYLADIFAAYSDVHTAWSKPLWDIATIAYLINQTWVSTSLVHSPLISDRLTWSFDTSRHFIRSAQYIYRDPIFRDLFNKLNSRSKFPGLHPGLG